MTLSERDRRLLEELELSLHEDDPRLDAKLNPPTHAVWTTRQLWAGGSLLVIGMLVMVGGVGLGSMWVGALGFVTMVGGAMCVAPPPGTQVVLSPRRGRERDEP